MPDLEINSFSGTMLFTMAALTLKTHVTSGERNPRTLPEALIVGGYSNPIHFLYAILVKNT